MTPSEGQRTVRAAMHVVAETLTAHGFAAHAEDRGETTAVLELLADSGAAVVVATHDEQVMAWCDHVGELDDATLRVRR